MIGTQPLVEGDGSADSHKLPRWGKLYQIYYKMHECSDLFNMQNKFVSITLHAVSISSGSAQISQCGFCIFLFKHFSAFKLHSHNGTDFQLQYNTFLVLLLEPGCKASSLYPAWSPNQQQTCACIQQTRLLDYLFLLYFFFPEINSQY